MYARKLLQCVQLLLHLLRDYDKHFTDGRPKCVVVQDAKQFISGQFLLDYGPGWFLLYKHIMETL